jgi:type IV pilus assembly protein PilA
LIELVVVVAIVGLLAAIAGPQLAGARERTYVAAMKVNLRNFATAEESYFCDFAMYSSDVSQVQIRGFSTSQDVTIQVNEATLSGWSATVTHTRSPVSCYMFMGTAAPVGAATSEGVIACS